MVPWLVTARLHVRGGVITARLTSREGLGQLEPCTDVSSSPIVIIYLFCRMNFPSLIAIFVCVALIAVAASAMVSRRILGAHLNGNHYRGIFFVVRFVKSN